MRVTKPRRLILETLERTTQHLSAEEIFLLVHKAYPTVGLTTVYRTLDFLDTMGVVSSENFGDGRCRYELADNPNKPGHHHHLVCTSCRRIVEYDDFVDEEVRLIRKVEKQLSRKHGFRITGHTITFNGVCTACTVRTRSRVSITKLGASHA